MVPTPCLKYKTKISLHTEQKQKKNKKKTHLHSSIMKEKEKEVSDQNPGNACQGKRVGSSGTGMGLGVRSESEKEKTKMRERQRRAITTNIFHGLRKHGGYRLNPRADINEVLRELAKEAGWVIEPNGTTYRSNPSILNRCPVCGTLRSSTPTPTSSVVGGGGGECSSADVNINGDIPMGLYVYGGGYESGVNVRESVSVCERDAIDGSGGGDGGSFNGGDVRTFAGSEGF